MYSFADLCNVPPKGVSPGSGLSLWLCALGLPEMKGIGRDAGKAGKEAGPMGIPGAHSAGCVWGSG